MKPSPQSERFTFNTKPFRMIKRIVKLTFQPEHTSSFVEIFNQSQAKILQFDGCKHLELWQDAQNECIFFTYSYWESEAHLNAYRHADFFKATWKKTKALFADKPEAWSVQVIHPSL